MNEYLISLSSFYKAAYGQEILTEAGIRTVLKRTPPNLVGSCGYALTVRTENIYNITGKLQRKGIIPIQTFLAEEINGKTTYTPIDRIK